MAYFKYADFFIENINWAFNSQYSLLNITLPLAISFFTFQQIAYLVDAYRGETKEYNFVDYCVFVTFFPQLIAGPIVHHKEMMPQFADSKNKSINYDNIAVGLFIFSIGLFKKVVIADTFSPWVHNGFDVAETLNFFEAWATSLSYTFQLYFDFSGYVDMAIGVALIFNIRLPINFNSPYKSLNIQDFWRRWHITLSRFLRDYIYIPLGGNRNGSFRTYHNLMATFIIGGIWHGAGWTFVFWGFLHGLALVIHRFWSKLGIKLNKILAWLITFNFINFAWVFFRAEEWQDAIKVLKGMVGLNGIALPSILATKLNFLESYGVKFGGWMLTVTNNSGKKLIFYLCVSFVLVVCFKNSMTLLDKKDFKYRHAVYYALMFMIAVFGILASNHSEFIYFNF